MTTLQIEIEDSRPVAARCDSEHLEVTLADGRVVQTPLWWYPRLAKASEIARQNIELTPMGLHWPQVDEDISVASMLRGEKAPGAKPPA
jgi:hypothetical protein